MITGNKITQEPDNPSKKAKLDSNIDETKPNIKLTPPPYKNSKTTLVVLMIIHMNLMILQVILMVVQEILVMNIKMKRMTITLTLHIKK